MRQRSKQVISLALTWDGVRWPTKSLPPKARAFLRAKSAKLTTVSAQKATELFSQDEVIECRICWVPRLQGGPHVLSEPFMTPSGKRLGFTARRMVRFGDVLGVVYLKH